MISVCKEAKNIPMSISILHEQEYNNLCLMYKFIKSEKRRAFSEKNVNKGNTKLTINTPKPHMSKLTIEPTTLNLKNQ
jgi:hypothetical protein